jgi:ABC-type phosphate/phosphonate transport system substrate-binding protein
MTWKIALPMYNVSPAVQRGYEALAGALAARIGEEFSLERSADLRAVWQRRDLLLGQTCGYPYMTLLRDEVVLVATPCFDFAGCDDSDYSSVIVVREGGGVETLADARGGIAAVNDPHSNSGMNVLRHAVAPLAREGRFFNEVRWSGSHAASLRMVREGSADIAAIDCVTYGYIEQEDPASLRGLRILRYSVSSPGLPLIASRAVPEALVKRLRAVLLDPDEGVLEAMRALRIRACEYRPEVEYQAILSIEDAALRAGYPVLE